jgi:valyl-tRNA synthetase
MIAHLARAGSINIGEPAPGAEVVTDVVPWEGEQVRVAVSTAASAEELVMEQARLQKELAKLEAEAQRMRSRLESADFVQRAPEQVVAETRSRAEEAQRRADALRLGIEAVSARLGDAGN